jgi:hypothetical protein
MGYNRIRNSRFAEAVLIEKIYTIPVNEAFGEESECAVCVLEKRFEKEMTEFFLGPSLMEPDHRVETNDKGFCSRHFEMLYDAEKNRLGLALILDTHYAKQIDRIAKASGSPDSIVSALDKIEKSCAVCDKLAFTLDRYIEVIFHLWLTETDYRASFERQPGFCLKHYKSLVAGAKKHLPRKELGPFTQILAKMQLENLKRTKTDLQGFIRKFDYRFADEPWGTAKDAVPRSIEKLKGFRNFKSRN